MKTAVLNRNKMRKRKKVEAKVTRTASKNPKTKILMFASKPIVPTIVTLKVP
jgi:hypothetical protein